MNAVTILRTVAELEDASMAQLVATYNALTGRTEDGEGIKRSVRKFENREVARRRVEQAMMAAQDADAHLGVPKGANGKVKTAEELAVKAQEQGKPAPNMNPEDEAPIFPAGTLANQLQQQAGKAPGPITPRPRAAAPAKKAPGAPRAARMTHAKLAPPEVERTSKVRDTSERGQVLSLIARAKGKPVAIQELADQLGWDARDHVKKLVLFNHVVICDDKGNPVGA